MRAGDATRLALREYANRTLVWFEEEKYSGAQLDHATDLMAHALAESSPPGARVGIWAWNSAETLVSHLAVERAGMVRVAIDPAAPDHEAADIAKAAGLHVVLIDAKHNSEQLSMPTINLDSFGLWSPAVPMAFLSPQISLEDPAMLVIRGVMPDGLLSIPLSVGNWEAHMSLAQSLLLDGSFGPALAQKPFFITVQQMQYGTGLLGTFPCLRMGIPQAILASFNAEQLRDTVITHDATATFLVPGMINRLCAAMPEHRPDPWRLTILYGGAPFPLSDMLTAVETLGKNLVQLYGRFEGGWPLTILGTHDHEQIAAGNERLAASCGREVAEVDLDLRPIAGAEDTELRVKSPCVSAAYRDPDGWCSLGDIAARDEHGYYYLRGRVDGMINTGSFHVYPAEVESAIREEYDDIVDVKVSAQTDPKWGQAVAATVQWTPGAEQISNVEFRERLGRRIAKYKVPTIIEHNTASA